MRAYTPGNPLVFTHVPKTVGTSLREAVKASLKPTVVFDGFGRAELGTFTDLDSVHPSIRRQIAFHPSELPADAQFISGHIEPSTTRARFPDADHFTVLREPRVRVLSTWLFARAQSDFNLRGWGGLAQWMRAARSNLPDYLSNPLVAPHVDNGITRLLLWPHTLIPAHGFIDPRHDVELFEEAAAVLESYAYTGIVESPDWVTGLSDWLGCRLTLPRLQEVSALAQPDTFDLAAEVSGRGDDLLRLRTRIDLRLWRCLAARTYDCLEIAGVAERAFQDALARYSVLGAVPAKLPYRRRVIERSYSMLTRLRP